MVTGTSFQLMIISTWGYFSSLVTKIGSLAVGSYLGEVFLETMGSLGAWWCFSQNRVLHLPRPQILTSGLLGFGKIRVFQGAVPDCPERYFTLLSVSASLLVLFELGAEYLDYFIIISSLGSSSRLLEEVFYSLGYT